MKPSRAKAQVGLIAALSTVIFTMLAIAALTAVRAQLATSAWPMFHHDLKHTGLSQFDTSADNGTQKWAFITGGYASSPAIGADGTIYVGSAKISNTGAPLPSQLYAVNPDGFVL